MAELLHRCGTACARRARTVLVVWVLLLGAAAAAFLVGFQGLTSSFDVPNTASGDVVATLEDKLPEFSGASGTVVFRTTDESPLSAGQQAAISELVTAASELPDVASVVDPFAAEQERAAQAAAVESGRPAVGDGRAEVAAAQAQLDAAFAQLDTAQDQLDAARGQAEAAGHPTSQLDAQQAQLDAQRAPLDEQQRLLTATSEELEAQSEQLETAAELLSLAENIRTVSDDGSTARVTIGFAETRLELDQESRDAVIDLFEAAPVDGTQMAFSSEISQGVPRILGVGEVVGVLVAAVVLVVVLGSWLAASFPIVTAVTGVGIGALATLAFSGVTQMTSVTPILGIMLGLAVGIDYSLFIINRHRKQILAGADVEESIGLSTGTAGTAVVFAGFTVIVALLALNVVGIPFLGLMGTIGAVSVAIAVLLAVSATPALLSLAGRRVLGRRARARADAAQTEHATSGPDQPEPPQASAPHDGGPAAIRPMPTWRAVVTTVGCIVTLLVVAVPALSMRYGLPAGDSEPEGTYAYEAFTITEEEFGEGSTSTLLVTADLPADLPEDRLQATQAGIARELAAHDDVVAAAPIAVSDDHRLAAFQVVPEEGPNSESTAQLVRDLRDTGTLAGGITIGVSGQAAINIDISEALADVLPLYLAVVVGLSFVIMVMVFRSLLVPLVATGGFVLSLFATYGVATAIFQWGWFGSLLGIHNPGPLVSFLPIILVGILFGLAMDYQLFMATGMREAYVHGSSARLAVAQGFRAGRRVVTAAALIMIAVFAGFVSSESSIIKSFGVGLAAGVFLDAFVVRMLLMPAVMHLLGRSAWWLPRWLDRIVPDVDVEGAALERRHPIQH